MAGPGCLFAAGCDNIKTQRIPKLSGITYRVAAVDEDLGIVWIRRQSRSMPMRCTMPYTVAHCANPALQASAHSISSLDIVRRLRLR